MESKIFTALGLAIFTASLLFSLSVKPGDANGAIQLGDIALQINYDAAILSIRNLSTFGAVISLAGALMCCATRIRVSFGVHTMFIVSLLVYQLRLLFETGDLKYLFAVIFLIVLYISSECISIFGESREQNQAVLGAAMLLYTTSLIYFNLYVWLSGQGYSNNGAEGRFFGATNHPNFLGMEMAVCATVQFSFLNHKRERALWSLFFGVNFLASILLVVLTGSRSAGVATIAGLIVSVIISRKNLTQSSAGFAAIALLLVLGVAGSLAATFGNGDIELSQAIERISSGENTREDVWRDMLSVFLENPLFGSGYSPNSESSILKALATAGIAAGAPLLIFMSGIGYLLVMENKFVSRFSAVDIAWRACLFLICLGSLFEGYLFELGGVMPTMVVMGASLLNVEFNRRRRPHIYGVV